LLQTEVVGLAELCKKPTGHRRQFRKQYFSSS